MKDMLEGKTPVCAPQIIARQPYPRPVIVMTASRRKPNMNHVKWWNNFAILEARWMNFEDPNVSRRNPVGGSWLSTQVLLYNRGMLAPERKAAMDYIGIVWCHKKQSHGGEKNVIPLSERKPFGCPIIGQVKEVQEWWEIFGAIEAKWLKGEPFDDQMLQWIARQHAKWSKLSVQRQRALKHIGAN